MDDIFGDNPQPTRVEDLVGEGKKFKTVEDLARGKAEADTFIERIKAEKAESDRRLAEITANSEAALAELREEMAALKASKTVDPQVQPTKPDKSIEAIVAEEITRAEQRRTAAQNVDEANRLMTEHFGTPKAAGEEVAKRATELGLTIPELRDLAARSPNAFRRIMVDGSSKPADVDLTRSTASPATAPKTALGANPGTKEFYQEMLRKDPRRYADPKTQAEILKHTLNGTYIP